MPFEHHPCLKPPHPDFSHPRLWMDDFMPKTSPPDGPVADWFSNIAFPMDLNDTQGDCGIAGMDHYQMSVSKFGGGTATSWGDSVCEQLYEILGGYVPGDPSTDNGTVLQDNLGYWRHNPIQGSEILGFGALRPGTWLRAERLHALHAFGPGYLGGPLPVSAEQQFPGPWTFVPGSPVAGGHCVTEAGEVTGTNEVRFTSWGAVVKASRGFFMSFVQEYWVIIDAAGIERNGANQYGWDVAGMNEALASLTGQRNPLRLKKIL